MVCSFTLLMVGDIWNALQVYSPLSFFITCLMDNPSAILSNLPPSTRAQDGNSLENHEKNYEINPLRMWMKSKIKNLTVQCLPIIIPSNIRHWITSYHALDESVLILFCTLYGGRINECYRLYRNNIIGFNGFLFNWQLQVRLLSIDGIYWKWSIQLTVDNHVEQKFPVASFRFACPRTIIHRWYRCEYQYRFIVPLLNIESSMLPINPLIVWIEPSQTRTIRLARYKVRVIFKMHHFIHRRH